MNTPSEPLRLGIDAGSTTVKIVVIPPGGGAGRDAEKFSRYARHNARIHETVRNLLAEAASAFPGARFRAAVCGSAGKPIADAIHAHYIQEVVANAVAVRAAYPQTRTAIELGGQDAKVVFFHYDTALGRLVAQDMRMNGSCAGGTGAFIDEVAALLQTPVEDFDALARRGAMVHEISGRCGVFAKTDIQPLLNQGGRPEDIALSTFHAVARQTIGGLAQGLEITFPVIFEGGPLTFNPTLIRVFAERLGMTEADIIRPEGAETLIARGAALSVDEVFTAAREPARGAARDDDDSFTLDAAIRALDGSRRQTAAALPLDRGKKLFFQSAADQKAFEERHRPPPPPAGPAGFAGGEAAAPKVLRVYLGIDAGSTTSKVALLDENENLVDSFYAGNRGEPLRVIKQGLLDMKRRWDQAGIALDIAGVGTTGYGELLFDKAFGADYHTVETVAHAEAARKYVGDASFILDIGGQDMKAIFLANGVVTNITLNEACSSGCGSFLENFAVNLRIPVEEIARSAFRSRNPAELGSRCTVFMNSTIITEQKNGKQGDDIMAGLCRSIIENVFTKVIRVSPAILGDRIVVQGGTFKNDAVLRALEQFLGKEVTRAPYPGEMGAIGIALLTKRRMGASSAGTASRRFIGWEALETLDYTQQTNLPCGLCANNCNRTLVTFTHSGAGSGATWVTGNRCERGENIGAPEDPAFQARARELSRRIDAAPDMIKTREHLLFKDYPVTPLRPDQGVTIGLPRALDFWRTMPFFTTFFRALGFKTRVSRPSTRKLFETGLPFVASDTVCFPAKLTHGHVHDLAAQGVDRIFFPQFNHLPTENPERLSVFTCPVLKAYPLTLRYSDDPEKRWGIAFDTPVFHWFRERDRDLQLTRYVTETFPGISAADARRAIAQGDAAMRAFQGDLEAEAARIIAMAEASGGFAVVIAGRHYQFDQLVNHGLSRYFTRVGIPVITVDALPGLSTVDLSKTMLDITNSNHARLLSGAILTARNPALEYVEVFSFGCGHDALYTDEVARLLDEIGGKAPLILKLDESDVAGPLRIRIRSFLETTRERRERAGAAAPRALGDPYPVKFAGRARRTRTVLIPNVSREFCRIISATLRRSGLRAEPLPMAGKEAIALGKQYVHNDSCFPAQVIIGEALAALRSGRWDPSEVAIGTGKTICDCRLTNYMALTRKALDEAGYPDVPILTTDFVDSKRLHPAFRFNPVIYAGAAACLIMTDILADLRRKIRPYEIVRGESDRVYGDAVDGIVEALERGRIAGVLRAYRKGVEALAQVRYDRSRPRRVVFITGEYLMTFHPGSNFHIEDYLERNGMEVALPRMFDVYRNLMLFHTVAEMKDFKVRHGLFDTLYAVLGERYAETALDVLEGIAGAHPLFAPSMRLPDLARLSDPIISHSIQSGEGFLMAADILHRAAAGVKAFVIIQPWGCLPNHVCGRGIIKRVKQDYPGIQILPLDYDPDTSFANIENRLQMLIMNARVSDGEPCIEPASPPPRARPAGPAGPVLRQVRQVQRALQDALGL